MPRNNSRTRRERRQADAKTRQSAWDALTDEQKAKRVIDRVGERTARDSNEFRKLGLLPD